MALKTPHRTDRISVHMAQEVYGPLKELSQTSGTPIIQLMAEAVALLLLERSQSVPPSCAKSFAAQSMVSIEREVSRQRRMLRAPPGRNHSGFPDR